MFTAYESVVSHELYADLITSQTDWVGWPSQMLIQGWCPGQPDIGIFLISELGLQMKQLPTRSIQLLNLLQI